MSVPPANCTYRCSKHPLSLFSSLENLREDLCDVTLKAGEIEFPVHKIILAASSPYFRAMFTGNMLERDMPVIDLKGVSEVGLTAVLDFIYTSEIHLNYDIIQDVLMAATHLQIMNLTEFCSQFLINQIDYNTYQMVFETSVAHGFKDCESRAIEFACANFSTIIKNKTYLSLNAESFAAILGHNNISNCSEFELFKSVVNWLEDKDLDHNYETAIKLLSQIRFHCVPYDFYDREILPRLQMKSEQSKDKQNCPWTFMIKQIHSYRCNIHSQPVNSSTMSSIRNGSMKLVVVGGKRMSFSSIYSDDIRVRNEDDTFWTHMALYPDKGISHACLAVLDNFLYIVGGQVDGEAKNIMHRYDPRIARWCAGLSPLGTPREYFHVSATNGKLFAIAGRNSLRQCLPTSEAYDPVTNTWSSIRSLDVSLACHAGTSTDNTVWVSGGVNNAGVYQNRLLAYNTVDDVWEVKEPARIKRVWHCMEAVGNKLYVFGGNECDASMDRVHCLATEIYNIKTNQWFLVKQILYGVIEACSAVLNDKIYLMGGYSQLKENAVATLQAYDLKTSRWTECNITLNEPVRGPSSCVLLIPDLLCK